jgi:signal transduction histidine kinase/CheY-like chemotaxis protein
VAIYVGEICFSLPSSLIWQIDDPFSKAISVDTMAASMMRLATVRSIHPATGFAGTLAIASLIAVSNSYYWGHRANWLGLGFTSMIAVVSIGYELAAIVQNYRQQRRAAVAQVALQRVSAAKSNFLSQMSHELHTPLNAIIGIGSAAQMMTEEPEVKSRLAVLVQSAEGLGMVLNDVLDMSAIEEGRIVLRPRLADVRQEIASTVALFRPQAEAARLQLILTFDDGLPAALRLDFDRLRQCLSNLLSNALRHTDDGQVRVDARLEGVDQLVVEVADTGMGVPEGAEELIFLKYRHAAKEAHGYGIGLSICRSIARRMGGDVAMVPSDRGATFRIRLTAEPFAGAGPSSGPIAAAPGLKGLTVLVVDDIASNRLVAATYLRLLECQPVEAASGREALALLAARPEIGLVLLDINMPRMDGLETLTSIRGLRRGAVPVPVIAMTADASDHDRLTYLGAGMDGYVTKPVLLAGLQAEILRVMR